MDYIFTTKRGSQATIFTILTDSFTKILMFIYPHGSYKFCNPGYSLSLL